MSGLVLTLREAPKQRVDVSPLTPTALAGKKPAEVAAITLLCGNRRIRADALFDIAGTMVMPGDEGSVTIKKATTRLDRIGAGMKAGTISVEGDAGAYAGFGMTGGVIEISGSAGVFTASTMEGGEIRIGGDVGDFLGAALPGERVGMRGGVVKVFGDAGARAGDQLRRGMLLIAGDAGPYCGARMIAGTILVLGKTGDRIGFGMRRGTILLAHAPAQMLATFNDCGQHELQFLRLLTQHIGGAKPFAALKRFGDRVRRYAGDRGVGGQGEILIREP